MVRKNIKEVIPPIEAFANIKVVGVGGSGGSAINRMVTAKIRGIDFIAVNTDAQALHHSVAPRKIHIGKNTTRGLGAGMDPDLGLKSAEENEQDIISELEGSDMVFITCGLGGGTGTGAAPLIASLAREVGALTVAVVTKPFTFEGVQRREIAQRGLEKLLDKVDAIITIPNDRLLQVIEKKTSLLEAFSIVDEVLKQGVQGISDVITVPGLVNVDFADVKAIMHQAGSAMMGIGRASGENRAKDAAKAAIDSPLLELSINGATGVLFTISGDSSLSMLEVNEAAEVITSSCDPEAKIIFGAVIDESLGDEIKVTVIATGFKAADHEKSSSAPLSQSKSSLSYPETFAKKEEERTLKRAFEKPRKEDEEKEERIELEKSKEEEELDIPAFLRKKLKNR
ncbi:MAG: cell division protein FtsZ [Patescibacteria group bacterium]|nr:cell division protein FtsZ [Patescibacteria group bacterium]